MSYAVDATRLRGHDAARNRRRLRSRRNFRRSRSEVPPQMPNCSLLLSAYSRHFVLTSHFEQTARANFDEPPRSGKKISGSASWHRALVCHSTGCNNFVVILCMSPAFPRRNRRRLSRGESHCCNSKLVIHHLTRGKVPSTGTGAARQRTSCRSPATSSPVSTGLVRCAAAPNSRASQAS